MAREERPSLPSSSVSRVINAVFGEEEKESERAREREGVDPINVPYILVFLSSLEWGRKETRGASAPPRYVRKWETLEILNDTMIL